VPQGDAVSHCEAVPPGDVPGGTVILQAELKLTLRDIPGHYLPARN
jgi:hypothetical protein